MTNQETMEMAREAGFDSHDMSADFTCNLMDIKRFANLVAAAEREACAKVCEEWGAFNNVAADCAAAIRQRGKTE